MTPRTIQTLVIRFLLAILIVAAWRQGAVYMEKKAPEIISQEAAATGEAVRMLQTAIDKLNGVVSPAEIPLAEVGPAYNFLGVLDKAAEAIQPVDLPNFPFFIPLSRDELTLNVFSTLRDTKLQKASQSVQNALKGADDLLTYHAAVSRALVNLWEYNAAADMANFSRTTPETDQRLKLATEGLAKAKEELNRLPSYSDPGLTRIRELVGQLQEKLERLKKDAPPEEWISVVSVAQDEIRSNRTDFWQKEKEPLLKELEEALTGLKQTQERWESLSR